MLNISLRPEYVLSLWGLRLTNTFITSVLVSLILIILSIILYYKKGGHQTFAIKGLKIIVFEFLKLTDSITRNRTLSKKILPLVTTFFLFIVSANLLGLIPGFLGSFFVKNGGKTVSLLRSPNSDLTTTAALAIFSVLSIQFFSLRALGVKGYLRRFFNFTNPLKFILGFFEILSEGIKVLSFSFRLFGNVFAGEILLLIIAFLVPYIIPLPFMALEVFVGIVQAFIFSMLTLVFVKTSTIKNL